MILGYYGGMVPSPADGRDTVKRELRTDDTQKLELRAGEDISLFGQAVWRAMVSSSLVVTLLG